MRSDELLSSRHDKWNVASDHMLRVVKQMFMGYKKSHKGIKDLKRFNKNIQRNFLRSKRRFLILKTLDYISQISSLSQKSD
ncbi:CLUMA_CG007685, isoform A [Clunio marinus]|uniref:CLUMA_CG007685, isoform A n=1 Tax=Clunio marinus TaxID=568069 RepID=A0A1J1I5G8_9DIPT|nr:CLUMA_CG007685, isoform A [Clunio marinus]